MEDSEWDFTWASRISHKAWNRPLPAEALRTPIIEDAPEEDTSCWGRMNRKRGAARYFKLKPC